MGIRKLINALSVLKAACFDRRAAFLLTALLCCVLFAEGCASVNSSEQAPAARRARRAACATDYARRAAHFDLRAVKP